MAAKDKSQWDFGELFAEGEIAKEPRPEKKKRAPCKKSPAKVKKKASDPKVASLEPGESPKPAPEPEEEITFSVSQLTRRIKRTLEDELGRVSVSGEISNFRAQTSGHMYFSLKDDGAQLSCVLFKGARVACKALLANGIEVILRGQLSVYAQRGQYQLIVSGAELKGEGALQAAFDRLKRKLSNEGLFDEERKQIIPEKPNAIGIITSATGAAIRDVLHVIKRRDPGLHVYIYPSLVQGNGSAISIARGIEALNRFSHDGKKLDLILLTRGGGSLEDLWAFNEEPVARAIAASLLPIVSAVGHEIDFSISDFTSDKRAATPSAAAELITEGVFGTRDLVEGCTAYMGNIVRQRISREFSNLQSLEGRLQRNHPQRRINDHFQRLDELTTRLQRAALAAVKENQSRLIQAGQRLRGIQPLRIIKEHRQELQSLDEQMAITMERKVEALKQRFEKARSSLRLLSPQNTLDRGYSITTDARTDELIRDVSNLKPGQELKTQLAKGAIKSKVSKKD